MEKFQSLLEFYETGEEIFSTICLSLRADEPDALCTYTVLKLLDDCTVPVLLELFTKEEF